MQLALGLLLGSALAWGAWRLETLTPDGARAAALLGALVFGLGGLPWAVLLLTFFGTSSALSRAFQRRKRPLGEKFAKGSRRDAAQVLSNGGVVGLCAAAYALWPQALWLWSAGAGALAAVNADTWATELGVLSRAAPVLITSGKPVEKGASGGVTPLGTLATLGGAALLGALAAVLAPGGASWQAGLAVTLGGVFGSLLDSLLGATAQAVYYCPACTTETEHHPRHTCGAPTRRLRGRPWLDNDAVNLLASLAGALTAAGAIALL